MNLSDYSLTVRKLLLLVICSLIGAVSFGLSLFFIQEEHKAKQNEAALFWNGYAKLFYEQTQNWNGLQERLDNDRYMQAEDVIEAAVFYSSDGSEAASIGDRRSFRNTKKLPILSEGNIVGYTVVKVHEPQGTLISAILISISIALVLYVAGLLHLHKLSKRSEEAERRIANLLLNQLNPSKYTSRNGNLIELEQELEELLIKVERLETVRRTMVAEIAHELRTPLAIMQTQLENALYTGQPLPMEKVISLHEENIRLFKLVKDLQELSLAESGHLPLDKGWFSLTELVESVIEALSVEGEERGIQTNFSAYQDIRIHADETRLRQVIVNLLGNAYKHARGRIDIDIQLDNLHAVVTIKDDGWGMEEEDLQHVFDRFYRAGDYSNNNADNANRTGGIGLGLAIVKEFVQAHQGIVRAESEFGKGSSFQFVLPVIAE